LFDVHSGVLNAFRARKKKEKKGKRRKLPQRLLSLFIPLPVQKTWLLLVAKIEPRKKRRRKKRKRKGKGSPVVYKAHAYWRRTLCQSSSGLLRSMSWEGERGGGKGREGEKVLKGPATTSELAIQLH